MRQIDRMAEFMRENCSVHLEVIIEPTRLGIDDNPALRDGAGGFIGPLRARDAEYARGSAKECLQYPCVSVINYMDAATIIRTEDQGCGRRILYVGQTDRGEIADDLSLE